MRTAPCLRLTLIWLAALTLSAVRISPPANLRQCWYSISLPQINTTGCLSMHMCVRQTQCIPDVGTNIGPHFNCKVTHVTVENYNLLTTLRETETFSDLTALIHAQVSVRSERFHLVKAVLFTDTSWSSSGCFLITVKLQTPVSWASTRSICSYYCCQESDVSSHTGKKVCL